MEKMAKSIIIIGIMALMGYMSISRNEPVVGKKAIKNKYTFFKTAILTKFI
jgi:hypothetical protein